MKNGSNARAPHTQNARAGHPPVVQKKGRNPLHHCSTKDPFSRRFTKHDYFYAHRIIFYVSFQIVKQIHINKYVSVVNSRVERRATIYN